MLQQMSNVVVSDLNSGMKLEFYSPDDPKPELKRRLVLEIYPPQGSVDVEKEEEAPSEQLDCKFVKSELCTFLTEGFEVGSEISFEKDDFPDMYELVINSIDAFIMEER